MYPFELIDIFNGFFSIVMTTASFIFAAKIISVYFKYKVPHVIFLGISLLGLNAVNWPRMVTFISLLLTSNPISTELYFILARGHSIGLISWMIGWILIIEMKKKNKKMILISYLILEAIYLSFFYTFIFLDVSLIGTYTPVFNITSGSLVAIHSIIMTILMFTTIGKLYFDTRKVKNKETRIKITFICFGILSIISMGIIVLVITLFMPVNVYIVGQIVSIMGVSCIYIGTVFPNWIKKSLIKYE